MELRGKLARFAATALSVGVLLVGGVSGVAPADAATGNNATSTPATYSNPVTAGVVDTFPDPSMIRGKDGAWYAYGTTNPIFNSSGEDGEHLLPILRSENMVTWTYVGDVVAPDAVPAFWPGNARAWAPDIRYVDGRYYLTYALSTGGVALATAPTPTGPWTHHGLLVPRAAMAGCPTGNIDQALFTDTDDTHYLYWGSYDVICVSRMNADATALTGPVTQVAQGRRMEGGYVVRHGDFYYLMYSDAGCCDGAFSGYTVKVGRSHSPFGPFVDDTGTDLMNQSSKGGFVLAPNGNGFTGVGHNAVQTDLSGQDWIVYHAISNADPDFPPVQTRAGRLNLSRRPMMIDRLDWIDGWPVVNAGAGGSVSGATAPVTTGPVDDDFTAGLSAWESRGPVTLGDETDSGHFARLGDGAVLTSKVHTDGDVRAQADVRTSAGGTVGLRAGVTGRNGAVAWIDSQAGELRVEVTHGGTTVRSSSPLPATFDATTWKVLTLDWVGDDVTASVSEDNLIDPLAVTTVTAPRNATPGGSVAVTALHGTGDADNVSAAPAARPVTARVPDPVPGPLLTAYSDDFDGTGTPGTGDSAWSWVRQPATGPRQQNGQLLWPTQAAELYTGTNTASVLLRDAPSSDYLVETKLTFDGTRPAQQAGLVLYQNDDRYLKLVHSVLPENGKAGQVLQQTEFDKEAERPTATPPLAVANGPMFGAAPAATTWLRLYVRHDTAHNEYDVRMASSTDGARWEWGGTWSLTDQGALRIGLVSMNTAGATASFDYVHTYDMAQAARNGADS
ncbi:family 43 glycosylhydrolase [Actinacidiphila acidipaludis]|uniref:Family 43 glycosylhydrolase n=1 Tax=Actinacidiphila acidipaludis TaxID=2873382 RepID=A0ABS7QAX1_9ACTN|nr:family 43 glycosylhydrolase [Streptomyces acidipaludis]MBY8880266.1 family 43 glycosylhydrolase [Streptomyces acidipaludis]